MPTELNILLRYMTVFTKFVVITAPQKGACPLLIIKQSLVITRTMQSIGLSTKMLLKNNACQKYALCM